MFNLINDVGVESVGNIVLSIYILQYFLNMKRGGRKKEGGVSVGWKEGG